MLTGRTIVDVLSGASSCKAQAACCSNKNEQVCPSSVVREVGEKARLWLIDVFRAVPAMSASVALLSQVSTKDFFVFV